MSAAVSMSFIMRPFVPALKPSAILLPPNALIARDTLMPLAARFQMTGHRAIELAHLQRVLDPLRTVQCSVKRYRDNHGTPLLK